MANAIAESELGDIEWLVSRARSFPKSDPYSSKAWLLTAKSLFPSSFGVQFESYLVEKSVKNVNEAARHLQDMLMSFPQEPRLWAEVQSILESLRQDDHDPTAEFLTDMFGAIPTSIQCQVLFKVSEQISDVLERSRLLLVAMEKFPNLIHEHGLKLVEMLVTEESNSGIVNSPVNCYRKLLVCDVMPLVLEKSGRLEVNKFHLCIWLQRAIEFYVSYVSQPTATSSDTFSADNPGESPPNQGKESYGLTALASADMQVVDPWGSLFKLLVLIGKQLDWDMERDLVSKSREYQIQSLNHKLVRAKDNPVSDSKSKQLLYTAMVLYVYSVISYINLVDTETCHSAGSGHQGILVLVNGFNKKTASEEEDTSPAVKKAKQDKSSSSSSSVAKIHPAISITSPAVILHHFETAVLCMDLLNSTDQMKFEFFSLCQNWQRETQMIMNFFHIDMNLYQGNYKEALNLIENPPFAITTTITKRKMSLQKACCYFSLKEHKKACEMAIELVESIPSLTSPNEPSNVLRESVEDILTTDSKKKDTADQLVLFQLTTSHIFLYSLQLFIAALKDKMHIVESKDTVLAHMLILLQYSWPVQEDLFLDVIGSIQKSNSFTYNQFFSYIHHVDFLEEFAFLETAEGGKVNLDIMPISTKALAQQRTVTRGVNKGVKEDFKAALEKQVSSHSDPIEDIIKKFLKDEREELLQSVS